MSKEELAIRCEDLMNVDRDSLYFFPLYDDDVKNLLDMREYPLRAFDEGLGSMVDCYFAVRLWRVRIPDFSLRFPIFTD
jgi:hypothetical protein